MASNKVTIIAEAGVNHNGSLELALQLVDQAAACGADIVKFQTFRASELVSKSAKKAEYQARNTGTSESQLEMIRKLELSPSDHEVLMARCREKGIEFLSSPFDFMSLDFLVKDLKLACIKLGSGELTNAPLLLKAAQSKSELILSTGMATLDDVRLALSVAAYGLLGGTQPSAKAFADAFSSLEGQALLRQKVTILHCTTEYPAPFAEVNLAAMDTLRNEFGLRVGFSDHTEGVAIPIAAVARGAKVIEKHFTLDRKLPGPDHKASLEPAELKAMVDGIRQTEAALGTGLKQPTASESKNIAIARKSLVARKAIRSGEKFTSENIGIKRPGNGLPPIHYWEFLGKTAQRDFDEDELLTL